MDIIASHRLGLIEQLEAEAVALAGQRRESAQRAVVYHHVADMMGLAHGYALLAAHGALAIDAAVARMERQARRSYMRLGRGERVALMERVAEFGCTMRGLDGQRCAAVLMAYRLAATPGLGGETKQRLDPALLTALRAAQSARGRTDAEVRRNLFVAHEYMVEALIGESLDDALATLGWPLAPHWVQRAVDALRIPVASYERADKRGLARFERRLRASKRLPPAFAANPAQVFFAAQRRVAERRRRAADVDHLAPDEAVSLAA